MFGVVLQCVDRQYMCVPFGGFGGGGGGGGKGISSSRLKDTAGWRKWFTTLKSPTRRCEQFLTGTTFLGNWHQLHSWNPSSPCCLNRIPGPLLSFFLFSSFFPPFQSLPNCAPLAYKVTEPSTWWSRSIHGRSSIVVWCAEMAAVSCGTSHSSAVSTPLRWIFKSRGRHEKLFTHVELQASTVSLLYKGDQLKQEESRGAGIAQWLEHRTRDWKVAGSNPCWNGGRIFFCRVNFLCWLLFRYPFHPRVTTVARKKSRSFCQKCRWQVTAKHAYTLRMWILLNRASAFVTTCP